MATQTLPRRFRHADAGKACYPCGYSSLWVLAVAAHVRLISFCSIGLLLYGCAIPSVFKLGSADSSPAVVEPAPIPTRTIVPPAPETLKALKQAQALVAAVKQSDSSYVDADLVLAQAQVAADEGNNPRAQSLSRQALARARYAQETLRTRQAAEELRQFYELTGLSDDHLASLRAAEAALIRGENLLALNRLQALRKNVTAPRKHTVRAGETLMSIAARPDVYDNSLLWPLIWEANRSSVADPKNLRAGQVLKIRPSPSVEEVVAAIEKARKAPQSLRVGPVTASPNP